MAALKDQISPELVGTMAAGFAAAWPEFERERFEPLAGDGLDTLELKPGSVTSRQRSSQRCPPTLQRRIG
jgi:hypothetical protein